MATGSLVCAKPNPKPDFEVQLLCTAAPLFGAPRFFYWEGLALPYFMVRIQKILAEAGVASRRACEALITSGRVSVNGRIVTALGSKADPARDSIELDGQIVRAKRKHYLALHKPKGYLCANSDPAGRQLLLDLLPPEWNSVYPVGRLDRDSEGLIFLTNDGDFCLRLTHPRYGVRKIYIVSVAGRLPPEAMEKMRQGVEHDGETLKAASVRMCSTSNSTTVLEIHLLEGRNREIRRMLEALGFEVERLVRVQIGNIKLGDLKPGRWRTLTETEIKTLLANV